MPILTYLCRPGYTASDVRDESADRGDSLGCWISIERWELSRGRDGGRTKRVFREVIGIGVGDLFGVGCADSSGKSE